MLDEESKDDSDSHMIFNEQNKCKASTEMVRIILSTCLHEMEKLLQLFVSPEVGTSKTNPYAECCFP
jgi:hypothetical protein